MSDAQGRPGRAQRWDARAPQADVTRVRQWAQERVPDKVHDQVRLDVETQGPTITIVERRPPQPGLGSEWTRRRIAQLRYDPSAELWTLCHSDAYQRWHVTDLPPTPDVRVLIDEMERDPDGVFWA